MTVDSLKTKLASVLSGAALQENACACRDLLELCVDFVYERNNAIKPSNASLLELIEGAVVRSYIGGDQDIIRSLDYVRIIGGNAKNGRVVRKKEVELARENVKAFVEFIDAKENQVVGYKKPPYMTEAKTRSLYIDQYIQEAGWEMLDKENVVVAGKVGIEIRVDGMPNAQGFGFCDYVLFGRDGKPLAIVEAKKTTVSPDVGRHQVDLYAECMEKVYGYKPVMYYTNGYSTRIIDGIYPDREVRAFHSINELELMIQRRKRGDITDLRINDAITNRPYQKIAITKICEWLNLKHRRGLLVMATGTGKTRVAISIVELLARNNWVKNVLFLADRTALVNQAKRSFAKLMSNMSICELSGAGEKDFNARLMFCTYQTMINYIDAEDKRFSTGRFDLIIIDEAHRSIFNRYGTIFKYFDSLLIGLTATPKDEVDANTYQIFGCEAGCPNYHYSLTDAVRDHYLVGYTVRNRSSKLMTEGIAYDSLSDEQKAQLEEYFDDEEPPTLDQSAPGTTIAGTELFKYLFNKDTCRQVIEDLMRWGLRVDGGETMGKTIIFAYNHKHAQMIVDCFREMYPSYPSNTCQLVDYSVNYGDDLVIKFGEDPEFRIAVSVDMLDTGVDVPAVLNLMFFKKVRSKIKFVQMIGRGTRLCENLFGPGKDKTEFQIFDYCGNFEYFGIHTDGEPAKETLTLSQRLFNVRIDMLFELQRLEYQQNERYFSYYKKIKEELHGNVVHIKSQQSSRIQVHEEMQYVDKYYNLDTWTSLSPVMVKEAKRHISPLVDSGLQGDYLSVTFDILVYTVENDLLRTGTIQNVTEYIKKLRKVAKYLVDEKASVPQVRNKAKELLRLYSEELWDGPTVDELETLRIALRDLMQFLHDWSKKPVDIDIPDVINDDDYVPVDIDIRTYREKVIDYLAEHSDNPVIKKIYNLEPITMTDVQELETILWHDLGSREDYDQASKSDNLAVFVRSLIGLSQQAVNERFGDYLNGNTFNSQQQEFIQTIINYVRENGDVEVYDLVNTDPFNNYDIGELFGTDIVVVKSIVDTLHNSVIAGAA